MKLLILCLGFYLASFTLAKAQDSTETQRKDTTALSDTTRITDSLKANSWPKDSLMRTNTDSDTADKPKTIPYNQKKPIQADTADKAHQNTTNQDTIVDIFEEMKKAKQEQDRSMQEDAKKDRDVPPTIDSSQNKTEKNTTDIGPDAVSSDSTKKTSDKPAENQAANQVANQANNSSDSTQTQNDPLINATESDDLPDAEDQKTTDSTNQDLEMAPEKSTNPPRDAVPADMDTTKSSATGQETLSTTADSIANKPVDKSMATATDSVAVQNPVRDTIQSLFTLPPARTTDKESEPGDSAESIGSTLNDSMQQPAAMPVQTSILDSASEKENRAGDSTRTEQNTAIKEIFSDVAQEKTNVVDSIDADSSKSPVDANSNTASQTAAPAPVDTPSTPTGRLDNIDSTEQGSAAQRLEVGRQELDSAINATQATESGTPFSQLFQPYRKFSKNTSIESTTNLTILQQHVNYKTKANFSTQFQRTGQEGIGYQFDVSVVRLNTEVETMGVQLKYDSNTPTDSTSTFAKPLFDIVGKRTSLTVDSTGKIMAVDTSKLGQQVNTVLSGLSLSGGDYEVGSNFGLLLNNETNVLKVGQSWTDSIRQGVNQRVTTYKVLSLVDDEYIVLISGTVAQTGEIASDGLVFKTHFTGIQKGKMRVDKTTRLIKTKEITLDMKGTVDYQDNELPAEAISKIKESIIEE